MKTFAIEILKQLFGFSSPREGKIILTNHAISRMYEYGLDERTIRDVFRNGKERKPGMIIQTFTNTLWVFITNMKKANI
jgi:hypothetical protein